MIKFIDFLNTYNFRLIIGENSHYEENTDIIRVYPSSEELSSSAYFELGVNDWGPEKMNILLFTLSPEIQNSYIENMRLDGETETLFVYLLNNDRAEELI